MKIPITRIQGASCDGLDTHKSKYFKLGLSKATNGLFKPIKICDPFARDCEWGDPYTNDINENTKAKHHLDALEFLKAYPAEYFDVVLFDPPFSPIQAERRYECGLENIYTQGGYLSKVYFECARILKVNGKFLKLGYNSNRPHPSLVLKEMWVTCFGGNRNDVIMSLWNKEQTSILDY